jgi:TonB family protein
MVNKLSKFGLLILLLGVLLSIDSNAQTPVCNLQFEVFDLNGEQTVKPIENVKAILTNLGTNETKKLSDSTKTSLFSNLISGKYKIEIIKDDYQRRVKEFDLNCKAADKILTISKVLYLQKGDVKEVTKFDSAVINAKDFAQEYKGKPVAVVLVKPEYPKSARAVRASGAVQVQVTLDEDGEIVSAEAISGHPLLRQAAEIAAKGSRFAPTLLEDQPVIVTGIIVFNFVP